MKLRIKDNTLRLRLSKPEIDTIAKSGSVKSQIFFGLGNSLKYGIEIKDGEQSVSVENNENGLTVLVPKIIAESWVNTSQVGFSAEIPIFDGTKLSVLVEKDFQCLHRENEPKELLYPNPNFQ